MLRVLERNGNPCWRRAAGFRLSCHFVWPMVLLAHRAGIRGRVMNCQSYSLRPIIGDAMAASALAKPVSPGPARLTRDPYCYWHEPSKRWIMVMALDREASDVDNRFYMLWSSSLRQWHELQRAGMERVLS